MRTIKFRAFDKTKGRFVNIYREPVYRGDGYYFIRLKDCKVVEVFNDKRDIYPFVYEQDFEITQYTGIDDCNGREIYEGDIVKLDEDFAKAQGYLSTISEVVWDEDGALFDIPRIQYALSQHNSKYFTVIGNIYENPQLI